ncbi:glycoside hydrolase family 128 protein [Ceratobasidium sp. AG-Ba]|nr:glycoside hydrolase family 128 protein [Ceratobasidium sp. AG-Ba]
MSFTKSRLGKLSSFGLLLSQATSTNAAILSKRQASSGSNLKAGLGWGGGGNISQFEGHQVGWYFTWSPQSWVTPPPALEFIPQLWGARDTALFASVVNATSIAANGWKDVLGMNEPQEPTQANLTAQEGATMWKTYLEPLKSAGVRLGSPATTSAPNGKTWIQDFLTACDGGCSVDFIALHWYGNIASEFIAYIEDFHNTFQRPIWVTEWSCLNFIGGAQCTYDETVQFLNVTQSYMDQAPWVERYAWFGAMANLPAGINNFTALMDPSGIINPLGQQYIGPPTGANPPATSTSITAPITSSAITSLIPTTTTSSFGTILTTTLTTTIASHSTGSTRTSSAPASTSTTPYVIIGGASMNHTPELATILLGALVGCGLLVL